MLFSRFKSKPKSKQPEFIMGMNMLELDATRAFLGWLLHYHEHFNMKLDLVERISIAYKMKLTGKNKHQYLQLLLDVGLIKIDEMSGKQVQVRWSQPETGKTFNFVVNFLKDGYMEIKLKFTDNQRRLNTMAYFLVWATKQTPYQVLPAVEFLELTQLCARPRFTRAMTVRLVELLNDSQIKSIDQIGRHLYFELQVPGHRHVEKYSISTFSKQIRHLKQS